MLRRLIARLRRFYRETRGSITLEAILFLPPLIGMFIMSLMLFDAFRSYNLSQKAAYAVGDAISRETNPLDSSYLDGMEDLFEEIVGRTEGFGLRVTIVGYRTSSSSYFVDWSQRRGDQYTNNVTTADLAAMTDSMPSMSNGERIIMVETSVDYEVPLALQSDPTETRAPMEMGINFSRLEMNSFMVTRPRFSPQICWNSCG